MPESHYIIMGIVHSIPEILCAAIAIAGLLCYGYVYRNTR